MNTAPVEPYLSFLKEAAIFQSAIGYLLSAHLAALRDAEGEIGKQHKRLTDKVAPIYNDPRSYFVARLFISHVAAFEIFLQETVAMVIKEHPKKVGSVEFRLADILDSSGTSELVQRATDDVLNRLMYKKPQEYLQEICALLSIERSTLEPTWSVLIEAKARRDLGVHNAWKCNATYLRKVREAGIAPTLAIGDSAVPQDSAYLDSVTDALDSLADTIAREVLEKHWPELLSLFPTNA